MKIRWLAGGVIGLALRLAHTISGSAPGMVRQTQLVKTKENLFLKLPKKNGVFMSSTVQRRLKRLARSMNLKALTE